MTSLSLRACGIAKNKYGFHEVVSKPSEAELKDYYANKYYQQSIQMHQREYSDDDLLWKRKKLEQKAYLAEQYRGNPVGNEVKKFLDVGAGEGFAMRYFSQSGWDVSGLDYSSYGCSVHNPAMLEKLFIGDIGRSIDGLIAEGASFELISMDNLLEHVLDPLVILQKIHRLLADKGVLIIEVPNDFSTLQLELLRLGRIDKPFWVVKPDHISYFNADGLRGLCDEAGYARFKLICDYPIDLALFNENTNYVMHSDAGKPVHKARMQVENLIHDISIDKAVKLYESFAELGLGRNLIGFFHKKSDL
ncbi:class I SAM-dependent methyltransferase [Methylomonas methanica]|uniref:Methyltransferase type 11 n=1 Tax=Methylomonas methanica (strain DSM 25384 / MC09) TaxID=857087 RepID=F9ZZF3_METMM|nr:class I SAM-dependent methyltransferase [Methylomonas methanica]AEG02346.1 Methyltransferase type 11 [Methylomonas methanica MC09]